MMQMHIFQFDRQAETPPKFKPSSSLPVQLPLFPISTYILPLSPQLWPSCSSAQRSSSVMNLLPGKLHKIFLLKNPQ